MSTVSRRSDCYSYL